MNQIEFILHLQYGMDSFRKCYNIPDEVSDEELLRSDLSIWMGKN